MHSAESREKMPETDKIAILLAAYNGEKYISDQIESLLKQTEQRWELFIHDDGSTDQTPEIIQSYEKRYPNRIHNLNGGPCGGAKNNFFYLMRNVHADYLMFCDQDDVWLPEKVEMTYRQMKKTESLYGDKKPLLVFSDLSVVNENLDLIADRMSVYQKLDPDHIKPKDVMIQNVITGCTVMINRVLAEFARKTNNTEKIIMHDWWCALLAACFGVVSYVDKPLVLYRQHGGNSVGAKNLNSLSYLSARIQTPKSIRDSLTATQKQTALFIATYPVNDPVLHEYGELSRKNKVSRLWFYIQNRIHKCGWKRNIGLLIWG